MKNILVLGGSQFMGKQLIEQLVQQDSYNIIYINRNKMHWNNQIKQYSKLSFYYHNRDEYKDMIQLLKYISKKHNFLSQKVTVIDFSAFNPKHIYSIYQSILHSIDLYIFISSDSVYDVCLLESQSIPIKEHQSTRPSDHNQQKKMNQDEEYGHRKLRCEQFLHEIQQQNDTNDFKYISLRLADVIGPYDNTHRFWSYVKWIEEYQQPLSIDLKELNDPLSFVYSIDVAYLIQHILQQIQDPTYLDSIANQSYNLAFDETITIENLLQMIVHSSTNPDKPIEYIKNAPAFYPSVISGPIDNTKAKTILGFKPTSIQQAVITSTCFYRSIRNQFAKEETHCHDKLRKKLKL